MLPVAWPRFRSLGAVPCRYRGPVHLSLLAMGAAVGVDDLAAEASPAAGVVSAIPGPLADLLHLRNAQRISHALAVEKLGLAPDEVIVNLTINLPDDAAAKWHQTKEREREAHEAAAEASILSRQVVQGLKAQGLTLQDISELLGLSVQRVHQLNQDVR